MKTVFHFFCAYCVLLFFASPAKAAATDGKAAGVRLTVELRDGSRVVGQALDESLKFHSPVLGEIKLATKDIRSMEFAVGDSAKLVTIGEDTLSLKMETPELRVRTSFGKVALPVASIRRLVVFATAYHRTPREGLVALWSGEGNADDSVNGHNGTDVFHMTFPIGKINQAFGFNGTNSYVTIPASTKLAVGDLTFECWIKPSDLDQPRPIIEYGGEGQASPLLLWLNYPSPGQLFGNVRDGSSSSYAVFSTAGIIPMNQWSHVALTVNLATRTTTLYCNGVKAGSSVSSAALNPPTFAPVNLGYRNMQSPDIYSGRRFAGLLDEVSIYNRALSASEILEDFEADNVIQP